MISSICDSNYKEKVIIELEKVEISKSKWGGPWWPSVQRRKDIKALEKVLEVIKSHLTSILTNEQKKTISFVIYDGVNSSFKHLNTYLLLKYVENSDFDIESFCEETVNIVNTIMQSVNIISTKPLVDLNTLVIEEDDIKSTIHEGDKVKVKTGLSKPIYKILENKLGLNSVRCKIPNQESITLNVSRTCNSKNKSDESELFLGHVQAVNDEKRLASIKINKSTIDYTFDPKLRGDLLTAQLNIRKINLEILITYQNFAGRKKTTGGHIIHCEENKQNEQLSCL